MSLRLLQRTSDLNICYLEEHKSLQVEPRLLWYAFDRCAYLAPRNTDKYHIHIKSGGIWCK